MQHYFSKAERAFYSEDVHGTRTILVPDPQWKRPMKEVDGQQVPDEDVPAPQIEISNPDCTIPADAQPIDFEELMGLFQYGNNSDYIDWSGDRPRVIPQEDLQAKQEAERYNADIMSKINALEQKAMRPIRENFLKSSDETAKMIADIDAQISELRSKLKR